MAETTDESAGGIHGRPGDLVAALLELDASAQPADAVLETLGRMLADESMGGFQAALDQYLSANEPGVPACVRLLDFASRGGPPLNVLTLTDRFLVRFDRDEALVDFRMRVLLGLGMKGELIAETERALARGIASIHLAFRAVLSINRVSGGRLEGVLDLYRRALARFVELIDTLPEKELWWGRYYRETGNALSSLSHYRSFCENAAPADRYRPAALREAADIVIARDRWGRNAPILLRAKEAGIVVRRPWRGDAAATAFAQTARAARLDSHANIPGTTVYSHLHDWVGSPECAFDYLVDRVLPGRAPYSPANGLLMIGTSLAGGGMERIFANTYRAVVSAGVFDTVRMALANFEPDGSTAFYLPESGAAARDILVLRNDEVPDFPISMLPIGLARRVLPAWRLVQRDRPRVIHAWNDSTGLVAAFAGLLAGCPRIFIHFHHMRAINLSADRNLIRSYPYCYRRLLERPEIELLFVADANADDYADWWSVPRTSKFKRLYNGVLDLAVPPAVGADLRRTLALPDGAPVLGTVFRFDAVKRPWLWIDTARLVHEKVPDAHFVMVGAGKDHEAARSRVASLGLSDCFHFAGQVRNVADYLACFDLFLMTSRVEGLPNSLVEAQMAGVPVISTNAGGARETFIPGVTGRLVDSDRAEDLADAVVACLADGAWRHRAAIKSRGAALDRFAIPRYLSSLLELYGATARQR